MNEIFQKERDALNKILQQSPFHAFALGGADHPGADADFRGLPLYQGPSRCDYAP
jgi:hypothetical protein